MSEQSDNTRAAKVALVTGATSGIGRAVAEGLAARGWSLAVCGRDQQRLDEVVRACHERGAQATVAEAFDITTPGAVQSFFEQVRGGLGQPEVVVHAAGVGLIKPAAETTDAEFTRVTNINLRGTFLVLKASCDGFAQSKRGLFITFPGILGRAVMRNASAYSASKFGVVGLVKSFAQEYQRLGVRFSLFFLGGVDTPFWDNLAMNPQRDKMIPLDAARDAVLSAMELPAHLVPSEITIQPESHQLV